MNTLLTNLLLETLPEDTDPILLSYIKTVLPAMEVEFSSLSALGGSYQIHYENLRAINNKYATENAQRYADKADQNLLVHVINALLTVWNLASYLNKPLTDEEKYLMCLGITLHDYNKYHLGNQQKSPTAADVEEIVKVCEELGEKLKFDQFWRDWRLYTSEIAYLAQNTQSKVGSNRVDSNYPPFKVKDSRRLKNPLTHLLAFADIAVHCQDPGDIFTEERGKRLGEHLRCLKINRYLRYHRLRDTLGIITNGIHNATLKFTAELNWQPLLYFAQGVVYLCPDKNEVPNAEELKDFIWQQINQVLLNKMFTGDIGFKRDGKGLKIAPQTLELFTPKQLIENLGEVISTKVANVKNPATPKRLEKLESTESEAEFLAKGADIRADRLAELIIIVQREFFSNSTEFIEWTLAFLELEKEIELDQTRAQSGGVNYGWYRVAATYVAKNSTMTLEEIDEKLKEYSQELAEWAEVNNLLPEHHSPTMEVFNSYLDSYLEVQGWPIADFSFDQELNNYNIAKTKAAKQPICSLSSGEFPSEDQMDSVVLFKPQQYSNKNPLGGGRIKRGISKIWSLEMLLRQAKWSIPSGKFEEQQPIFLYIFPAYLYSPQIAKAMRLLFNDIKRVNLWDVRKHWLDNEMNLDSLRYLPWRQEDAEVGRHGDKYSGEDLPFLGTVYTTTRGKSLTDAWVTPAFLAVALPFLLGVKVVATSSSVPLYRSDQDFPDSVILDGPANFWQLLQSSTSLRVQELPIVLKRLLTIYVIHLDNRSNPPDSRWQALNSTVREVITDVLNVFSLANEKLREDKREASHREVLRYWYFAENIFAEGDVQMTEKIKLTKELVSQYRCFYQVSLKDKPSSHSILLPLTKALEVILSTPQHLDDEELILQGSGQLQDALERQDKDRRPLVKYTTHDYKPSISKKELEAIHTFMSTCVKEVFRKMYKGDRALLQENRNRLKSGAEFAYRLLAIEANKQTTVES